MVAEPEEKARAYLACSRAAIQVSKLVLLGFADRVYSYSPTGFPTAVWAKVVEREIWECQGKDMCMQEGRYTDSMTAPVTGSIGDPACTARVPNFCTGEGALGGVSIGPPLLVGTVILEGSHVDPDGWS